MDAPAAGGARAWLLVLAAVLTFLPRAATVVQVVGRQLLVDGKPLHLKGVCWNPVPKGGIHPVDLDFRGFVETDSELMARAGINAVRTYETINDTEVLDVLWKHRIYVLNTVYIWGKAPTDSVVAPVEAVKNHPAILMWVVGNEWNYNGLYVGLPFPESLRKVTAAVKLIKQHDSAHPVATVHGEMPSLETLQALSDVDVWGINKYSGITFGDLFVQWAKVSAAPMFLGEYGADAYNTKISQIDEASQAKATTVLTEEIVKASSVQNGGVCIGGIIFEFADEWWKDGSGNPSKHDVGGVSPGGGPYPDMTFNEEWWGLVKYDGTPRQAYRAYASIVAPGLAAAPSLEAAGGMSQSAQIRNHACGSHFGCKGKLGLCCPSASGEFLGCCKAASSTPAPAQEPQLPSTTWLPPATLHLPGDSDHETSHDYMENSGKFANGHFKVGTSGCEGVGECQYKTRTDAQTFCDSQARCTCVLLHPFEDNCAGGFGCYTPRHGKISTNNLWDRSGGKAWIKGAEKQHPAVPEAPHSSRITYVFVGFTEAPNAQSLCSAYGRLAMPKTTAQQESLQAAVDAAQAAGKMSKTWPQNTIWLGGRWNYRKDPPRWEWDDGSAITEFNWAPGQPSAAKNQIIEPWLCMILNGEMHDSDPPYKFGVFCELDHWLGAAHEKHSAKAVPEKRTAQREARVRRKPATVAAPRIDFSTTPKPAPVSLLPSARAIPAGSPGKMHRKYGSFEFAGYFGPAEARRACGAGKRLVMAKTGQQRHDLLSAIASAMADGEMSDNWPENTVWLGGQWNGRSKRWEWDDGTAMEKVNWAPGQPSSKEEQKHEPWLCMVSDGKIHDSDPPYSFGVMCEPSGPSALAPLASVPSPAAAGGGAAPGEPGTFKFAGFATPVKARGACSAYGHMAMPKTSEQNDALLRAVEDAFAAGQMSRVWPNNTIWLGGRWSEEAGEWQWDDGTPIDKVNWAPDQPSSSKNQAREPWLCMVADGEVHDSEPYSFGVMCQVDDRRGSKPFLARKMLDLADEARPTIAFTTWARGPDARLRLVTWVKGPVASSCDLACLHHGGCSEDAWPESAQAFEQTVLQETRHTCQLQSGGHHYDPSTTGRYCGWEGPEQRSFGVVRRCWPAAPSGAQRFCPCSSGPSENHAGGEMPIWS